jgi:transcriptional regulator with XRE-family HTH domain
LERLSQARWAGLSQAPAALMSALAVRIGVALSTVQRLEAGGAARLATVAKLAEALQVEPADLMRQPPEG